MTLKKTLVATIIVFATIFCNYSNVYTYSSQPPTASTGAPGETTCARSSCHSGTPNSGSGELILTYSETALTYEPNTVYDFTVTVADDSKSRFGFQLVALNEDGSSAGNFIEAAPNMSISSNNGKEYISHQNVPNNATNAFSFQWQAPATTVGPITFYGVGNAADGNGSRSGDNIYTTSLTITPAETTTGIPNKPSTTITNISTYPNPVVDICNIDYTLLTRANVTISLQDMSGKIVEQKALGQQNAGTYQHTIDIANTLAKGIYLVTLQHNQEMVTKKIII